MPELCFVLLTAVYVAMLSLDLLVLTVCQMSLVLLTFSIPLSCSKHHVSSFSIDTVDGPKVIGLALNGAGYSPSTIACLPRVHL